MRTQNGAVISKLLTNVSNGYFPTGFVCEQVLPPVYVAQTTGKVGKYSNNHLRIVNTLHTGKGPYRQLESVTISSDNYEIEDHGLFDIVTENDMRNFETPFDAELDTTIGLTLAQYIAKEYGLATVLQNPSIITQGATLSGNAQYDKVDHADSDPIGDKIAADNAIETAVGGPSNTAIMSMKVFRYMSRHHKILGALGYTQYPPMGVSTAQLATVLQVDRVLVSDVMYNAAVEGQADNMLPIWGKHVVYARIFPPALRQKTLGFEFRKSGTTPRRIATFTPDMPLGARGIICADNYDQMILNAGCAYLIQNAIA